MIRGMEFYQNLSSWKLKDAPKLEYQIWLHNCFMTSLSIIVQCVGGLDLYLIFWEWAYWDI